MPLYDFKCSSGHRFERMVKLADFEVPQFCACNSPATRVISTPRFAVDNVDYQCPITGKHIFSKREHRENLARHDCRVFEPGEKEAASKLRKAEEDAFDKAIEETVEKQFEAMPSAKKEKLANELLGGSDVVVTRI